MHDEYPVSHRVCYLCRGFFTAINQVDLALQADDNCFQKQIYLNANAETHLRADDRLQRDLRPRLWPQH